MGVIPAAISLIIVFTVLFCICPHLILYDHYGKMLALKLYYLTSFCLCCHHIKVQFMVKIVSLHEDG